MGSSKRLLTSFKDNLPETAKMIVDMSGEFKIHSYHPALISDLTLSGDRNSQKDSHC